MWLFYFLYLISSFRLNKLLGNVVISQGGVVPFINPEVSFASPVIITSLSDDVSSALAQQVSEGKEGVSGGVDASFHWVSGSRVLPIYHHLYSVPIYVSCNDNLNDSAASLCCTFIIQFSV